ncbi:uncharacterized protein LOC143903226 [Temnothorax americanus]|uniref:uncharacterized protein LOC143903226 n=1 Tax=Temnothorax americanus TaxID=1964332 RepID=UPI004067A467
MPPKYPARRTRGKRKGQFAKKKVVLARENLITSVAKTRALKSQALASLQENGNLNNLAAHSRRIVELDTLASQLWCKNCDVALSLKNIVREKQLGLASVFYVKCMQCQCIHSVHTNDYNKKDRTYEVNAKLAFGLIDGGIGESHINTVLSSIDVPIVSALTLKKYERKVGVVIEEVAKESCIEAIRLEKKLTLKNEPEQNP